MRPCGEVNIHIIYKIYNMYLECYRFIGVVDVMPTRETYCTRWGLRSSNPLSFTIQTINVFIRGYYLKYPDFLSQGILFLTRSKISHILTDLGPPGSKCLG